MKFVLDSSAIVPILHEEDQSKNALQFIESCQDEGISLAVSTLVYYEIGNCIVQFAQKEKKNGQKYLSHLLAMQFEVVPMNNELLIFAMGLAQKERVTYYDAIHAGSALIENAPLITLDKELLTKFKNTMAVEEGIEYVKTLKTLKRD